MNDPVRMPDFQMMPEENHHSSKAEQSRPNVSLFSLKSESNFFSQHAVLCVFSLGEASLIITGVQVLWLAQVWLSSRCVPCSLSSHYPSTLHLGCSPMLYILLLLRGQATLDNYNGPCCDANWRSISRCSVWEVVLTENTIWTFDPSKSSSLTEGNAQCITLGTVIPDTGGFLTEPRTGMFVSCSDSQFIRCKPRNSPWNCMMNKKTLK